MHRTAEIDEHVLWTKAEVFPDKDFPFGIRFADPQTPHKLHTHEGFSELVIVYKGQGTHFTADEAYTIAAGDVYVIAGGREHGYRDPHDLYLVNVMFEPDRMLNRIPHIKKLPGYHALFQLEPRYRKQHKFDSRLRLSPDELTRVMSIVDEMHTELDRHGQGYQFVVTAVLMQAIALLCRCYARPRNRASDSLLHIADALSYIESHYADEVTLHDLCRVAQMPTRTFMRSFREATGLPPIDYLLRLRLARASDLLRTTSMPVTEIAYLVGFLDSNYFARQFRNVLGTTPTGYRNRMHLTAEA